MVMHGPRAWRARLNVLIAHPDGRFRIAAARHFRHMGLAVLSTSVPAVVRRLARTMEPGVVVLAAGGDEESGYLTCAKLKQERHEWKVILVDTLPSTEDEQFASFAGADALVDQSEGVEKLTDQLLDVAVARC